MIIYIMFIINKDMYTGEDTNENDKLETMYEQIRMADYRNNQVNNGYRLSFMVLCEYKKRILEERKKILSIYLLPEICWNIISFLILEHNTYSDLIYETDDEKNIHEHALKQIESWTRMRIVRSDMYSELFVGRIHSLIELGHRCTVQYNDLDIIRDAAINIIDPSYDRMPSMAMRPISLYDYNRMTTEPIIGIGRLTYDPHTILCMVIRWSSFDKKWQGLIFEQTSYDTKLRTIYGDLSENIILRLNQVGVFYVTK